jgi:hypothetical protein
LTRLIGADINPGYYFVATPLISVSGLIPSIGGWGVRETTSTAIFAPTGTGENTAAALGVALGAINLTVGLIGAIVYGVEAIQGLRTHD